MRHVLLYGQKGVLRMSLQRTRPEIQVAFTAPKKQEKKEYVEKFTEEYPDMEAVKAEHGKVVFCKYTDCLYNKELKGFHRTTGKILKNVTYKPIGEQEHIWSTVCTRDEIALTYHEYISKDAQKVKVPACFTSVTGVSGHMDFSKLLQPDGSPYGGSISSQHASDSGYGIFDR